MSTTQRKNTVGIAKSGTKKATARKPATRKPAPKAAPKLTPEQERDLKAKQKVQELLKDSPLADTKDELLVLDEVP